MEVGSDCNVFGYGHFGFFRMLKFDGITEQAARDLRSILPQNMSDNFNRAFSAFIDMGEDPEVEIIRETMDKYDEFTAEHSKEIADILSKYISERMVK